MLLSAALIVRDEAAHLARCLGSLEGLVDEIVVVDTGSTDDSAAIAEQHGARVDEHAWRDDFSAARNRSLDLARGEWVLYIDADEYVLPGANEEARRLLAGAADHVAFRVLFIPRLGWTPFREYRLFRNDPDIRFEGVMHETMVPALHRSAAANGAHIGDTDRVTIEHVGYEGDQRRKHARNEPLLLQAIADDPERTFLYDHLARTYEDLGDAARAVETWKRGVEVARARGGSHPDDRLVYIDLVIHLIARGEIDAEVDALVDEALGRFPGIPSLEWAAARRDHGLGRPASAAARLEWLTALSLDDVIATGSSYDGRLLGEWAWNLLGQCRFEVGDFAGATDAFRAAEAANPAERAYEVRRRLAEARAASSSG